MMGSMGDMRDDGHDDGPWDEHEWPRVAYAGGMPMMPHGPTRGGMGRMGQMDAMGDMDQMMGMMMGMMKR